MTFNPIAHYGVTSEMLDSVSGEYKAALLMIDSEIKSIENSHARRAEIKERLRQGREKLVAAYTDYSWMLQTALQGCAGGASIAAGVNMAEFAQFGKGASKLSGAPGQLNQQDIEGKRTLVSDAEAIQRELDGDARKTEDQLARIMQMVEKVADARLQAARAA